MVSEAALGPLGLSVLLSFCPSRTYHRPGLSSKCPSVHLLPIHYGTTGRTRKPPSRWAALPQWHRWTGLCQWDPHEQGLPCSCHGPPRPEASAALPRGASAGNMVLGMWANRWGLGWGSRGGCLLAPSLLVFNPGLLCLASSQEQLILLNTEQEIHSDYDVTFSLFNLLSSRMTPPAC